MGFGGNARSGLLGGMGSVFAVGFGWEPVDVEWNRRHAGNWHVGKRHRRIYDRRDRWRDGHRQRDRRNRR